MRAWCALSYSKLFFFKSLFGAIIVFHWKVQKLRVVFVVIVVVVCASMRPFPRSVAHVYT